MSDYEKVMEVLESVPGVKEHLNSLSVVLGFELLKFRINKNLTYNELASLSGLHKELIGKIECGDKDVEVGAYDKVFKALGIQSVDINLIEEDV